MWSLYKKELSSFFGNLTGYLVIGLFLLVNGLFLWVFPSNFNIFDSKIASLKPFFELAPTLYLFLIPAITMRMISEERRIGTLELLFTRPITSVKIILAKYLAALSLVVISLIPTLIYFIQIEFLGSPMGNIDSGATWGSYVGLVFLASAYIAIGLFASSLTSGQIVAFLIAALLSFSFFMGFDFVASTVLGSSLQGLLLNLGINEHYLSLSRGVIDSRDLSYFFLLTLIFIALTAIVLASKKSKYARSLITQWPAMLILVLLIVATQIRIFRIDLTAEKRYSISQPTKDILSKIDQNIYIEFFLTGDLPAGMEQLKQDFIEKVEDFNAYSKKRIILKETDIYKISKEKERDQFINNLLDFGVLPVNLQHKTEEGLSSTQIFPAALVQYGEFAEGVNILKNNPMLNDEQNLNQSSEMLEYELAKTIKMLMLDIRPTVAFLSGQGEADQYETGDIRYSLGATYNVISTTAQELWNNDTISTLVVADPSEVFSEADKLAIDQFIMKGKTVLWCIDPVLSNEDSLSKGYKTIAFDRELNLRDQLFKYGVRINSDLILDAECLLYAINTSPIGQPTKFVQAPFYFAPLAQPSAEHQLSRNLNRVMINFANSIDIIENMDSLKATPILTTSQYARTIQTPTEVSLQISRLQPQQLNLNQSYIPMGILVEGRFESAFKNRMTSQFGLSQNDLIKKGKASKQIFISDGDIIKNKIRETGGKIQIRPMGYDMNSGQTFGNKDFIINCIDYLNDDSNLTSLRTRSIKLRLLDNVKIKEQKSVFQILSIVAPIMVLAFAGIIYNLSRKRKFCNRRK